MDGIPLPTPVLPAPLLREALVWHACTDATPVPRPLSLARVRAGFPSPADDYIERELDIAALLIPNRTATYFVRVDGDSMTGAWIRPGDIAVVDCSLEARDGMVVIAILDNELVIKQLRHGPQGEVHLVPRNRRYQTLTVREGQDFRIWGVVTWTVHRQLP